MLFQRQAFSSLESKQEHSSFALHRMQPTYGPWLVYLTLLSLYMYVVGSCFLSFVPFSLHHMGWGGSWHWGPLNPTYTCGVHLPSVHNSVQVVKNC